MIQKLGKLLKFLISQSEEYLIRMFMTKPFEWIRDEMLGNLTRNWLCDICITQKQHN